MSRFYLELCDSQEIRVFLVFLRGPRNLTGKPGQAHVTIEEIQDSSHVRPYNMGRIVAVDLKAISLHHHANIIVMAVT